MQDYKIVRVELVDVNELIPHPRNPRRGDLEVIKESLLTHGQYKPIVVNLQTRHILAGNHTHRAAKELGYKKVWVAWVDVPEEEELKILVVDNRSSDLATYDTSELGQLLRDIADMEGGLFGSGFTEEDLESLDLEDPRVEDGELYSDRSSDGRVRIVLLVDKEHEMIVRDALIDLAAKVESLEVR